MKVINYIFIFCMFNFCFEEEVIAEPRGKNVEDMVCIISEEISAKFNKGKWLKNTIKKKNVVYQITYKENEAVVSELTDDEQAVKTACKYVGGTIGYQCEPVLKLIPFGEKINITLSRSLKEMHVMSKIQMREMGSFNAELKGYETYFDTIRFEIKLGFGKCVNLE